MVKHGDGSVFLWGALLLQEVEILTVWRTSWILYESIWKYQAILAKTVMPSVQRLKLDGLSCRTAIPKYSSKSTVAWFRDQFYNVLEWPVQSSEWISLHMFGGIWRKQW